MRLGLYGGTFDPVHMGHLLLAESCREQMRLDEVWFIPTGSPPHKVGVQIAPPKARREMLELALAGLPQFHVSRIELDRPGPHYTVETLGQLKGERPEDELFLLIGADSLHELHTWREPAEIARLAQIVAVNRGDEPLGATAGDFDLPTGERIQLATVKMPAVGVSATDLRRRVADGRSIRFQTPRAVEQYIRAHRLYQAGPEPEKSPAGQTVH
ncbi:MAG TPA: nicotinate-nucleotide adenylyltransferase [Caulifigura sp.]|jgi:nicotinate-nucleotide adenylyltransferase|nr:nicotinate-nucleotide adenylyltransferase [Caulifigura sp.]